ncbi:MAG: hypothetical protein QGH39_02280 [Candidatus Thermoplasmatota archaeon]|jgi:hypothetical protein|nr:hypothetical protein [Candidatus Thermoplasmatota archaeon]MDP7264367.1 hypothetical protein [Candidatus Thermoplasmatota archaeon]
MVSLDVLEFILVLTAFILGLVVGLVINSLRKERFSKLSPRDLSAIQTHPPSSEERFFPPPFPKAFSGLDEISAPAIVIEREETKVKRNIMQGAWVCSKCGAVDATLIHRKGCDKCYRV